MSISFSGIALENIVNPHDFNTIFNRALSFEKTYNDSVLYYADKALEVAIKDGNSQDQLDVLILIVTAEIKSGKLAEAIQHSIRADELALRTKNTGTHIDLMIYIGIIYQSMGLSSRALEYFLDAKNKAFENNYVQKEGDIHYYLASVYDDLNESELCRDNLLISISRLKENNKIKWIFKSYILLSNLYNNIDSINKYLTKAEEVIEKDQSMQLEKITLLNNQALLNKAMGNLTLSKAQYNEAIKIARQSGFQNYLSNLYNNYAYQLMAEHDYDSAYIVLKLALNLAIDLKDTDLRASIYDSYSDFFSSIKNFEKSLAYKDSSIVSRREYQDQQRIQESLFLSAVFETEQKERELLKQENQITRLWVFAISILAFFVAAIGLGFYLRQKLSLSKSKLVSVEKAKALGIAEALIQGQDDERKRLAMDLHDGPVANIGVLRFMVDGYFQKHAKYHEVIESIKSINRQVREISHRMLPAHIQEQGLILTIQHMIETINQSGKFKVDFQSNIISRHSDKLETNIYYLIYELINNAIKHSNGNSIFVQLIEQEDRFNLSVEDNGNGFDQTQVKDGIGLRNIKTRIDYLGGRLELNSDEQTTLFIIEIPTDKS